MGHLPRIPAWLRWEQSVIYFVTICVKDRKQVLANEPAFNALKNAAAKLREWRVLAAILMPDHLHVVVAPSERDAQLGNFSAALKRWMRKELSVRQALCLPSRVPCSHQRLASDALALQRLISIKRR